MPTLAEIGGTPDFDTNLFQSGKLAMWHNGIWQFNGLNESGVDYDVVVEPGMEQKANAVFMNGVVASADTDHPEAAAKWIEFFTSSPTTVDTRLASIVGTARGQRRGGIRQLPRGHTAGEPPGRARRARRHRACRR